MCNLYHATINVFYFPTPHLKTHHIPPSKSKTIKIIKKKNKKPLARTLVYRHNHVQSIAEPNKKRNYCWKKRQTKIKQKCNKTETKQKSIFRRVRVQV